MANLPNAKKAIRVTKRKTARNEKVRAKIVRLMKKTRKLVEKGEKKVAEQQLLNVYKALDKAAKRRIIHPNKAARMKSNITKKVNNIGSIKASTKKSPRTKTPKKRKKKTTTKKRTRRTTTTSKTKTAAKKTASKTRKKRKSTTTKKRKSSKTSTKKAK
ncbi:MAG: 30S ribosomal protein S20 [Patescibacteria group bacterium]|nr:30S ribosomal protein S20 [Patescibacteria group bacterium]